jgi:hypothetical protein
MACFGLNPGSRKLSPMDKANANSIAKNDLPSPPIPSKRIILLDGINGSNINFPLPHLLVLFLCL